MKKAVMIVGAESTGTKYVNKVFLSQGFYGDEHDPQRVVSALEEGIPLPDKVVFRQSVPHEKSFPRIVDMLWELQKRGFHCQVIVTARDPYCVVSSHCESMQHATCVAHSLKKFRDAYNYIFQSLYSASVEYIIVPYETWKEPRCVERVFWLLGLDKPGPLTPAFNDGNMKWYKEGVK